MIGSTQSFTQEPPAARHSVKLATVKRILVFAKPYASALSLFVVVVIVGAALGVITPLIFREILNNGILRNDITLIVRLAILTVILVLVESVAGLLGAYLSATIGARAVLDLRTALFKHIQRMPLAFFTHVQTGALVSRLNEDVTGAQSAFTDILTDVFGNSVTLVLVLAAMFTLSWQITLAALLLIPLIIILGHLWGRKLRMVFRESLDSTAAMNSLMVERFGVAGAHLAKAFGRLQDDSQEFEVKARGVSAISVKRAIYTRFFVVVFLLVASLGTALAYGWGGVLVVQHRLDIGTLIAFVAYLGRLYGPLMGFSKIQGSLMTALVSFERVFDVLDLAPMIQDHDRATVMPRGPARVSFDRVYFRYPSSSEVLPASLELFAVSDKRPQQTVLYDVTFVAEPGQLVALVGPSGCGKTTISHLVVRFYDVHGGSVSIDGIDVRNAQLNSLAQRIGIVTQEAYHFHGTIRANLLYAKPDATDLELTDALQTAQILEFVNSLPNGIDTPVGDRGYRLSGGERQRLTIAQLILKSPDIVILDEATAHLDSESEAAIQRSLEAALRGRTTIVIAHRLSTILKADQILVVNQGHIVERGTHAELLRNDGLYAELYRHQFASAALM